MSRLKVKLKLPLRRKESSFAVVLIKRLITVHPRKFFTSSSLSVIIQHEGEKAMTNSTFTDKELIDASLAGDKQCYEELICRYEPKLQIEANRLIRDLQLGEDMVQVVFIKAYQYLSALKDKNKFYQWLRMILRRVTFDFRKKGWIEGLKNELKERSLDPLDQVHWDKSLEKLINREENQAVVNALNALRKDYRDILVMKHIYKVPYLVIAKDLGMSRNAVGEKLSRARKMLKKRLSK
jgi:RNA polymerase sigma factor (sigma-70 family)